MPRINYARKNGWQNYHKTVTSDVREYGSYSATELGACDAVSTLSGPDRFRATRDVLHAYVRKGLQQQTRGGMIGKAWSFAPLVGRHDLELDLAGLAGCSLAAPAELHRNSKFDADRVALVSGGTTLRCLVNWGYKLSPRRSIRTSGTHLGPTIAGGYGTASHGSRLGFGGLQDMVIGMHLITGEKESVWIERASQPVLSDAAASRFATRIIHSDEKFEDSLIHLGGMGIVNGVALQLDPYQDYNVLAVVKPLWPEWLGLVEQGRFGEIAEHLADGNLGRPADPVFYEVTMDPFDNEGVRNAIHLMYFPGAPGLLPPDGGASAPTLPRAADAIAILAEKLMSQLPLDAGAERAAQDTAFSVYQRIFQTLYAEFTLPITPQTPRRGWENLHGDDITGGDPGGLYNASYAVKRSDLHAAIPLILGAADGLMPAFLYTIRFVTDPAGTLAFTRFPETAVIEIDGVSDNADGPTRHFGVHTKAGAMKIRAAFDIAGLDYSMHWAKLGQLDAPKIERDFGPSDDPRSRVSRWRATRASLLEPDARELFVNDALRSYGLLPLAV